MVDAGLAAGADGDAAADGGALHVADVDVFDVVFRSEPAAGGDHGGVEVAVGDGFFWFGIEVGEGDEIICGEAGEAVDAEVFTALAEVDAVFVEDVGFFAIDGDFFGIVDADVGDFCVVDAFEADCPGVGVFDGEVVHAEAVDFGDEDHDVAPVAGLFFFGVGGIAAVADAQAAGNAFFGWVEG